MRQADIVIDGPTEHIIDVLDTAYSPEPGSSIVIHEWIVRYELPPNTSLRVHLRRDGIHGVICDAGEAETAEASRSGQLTLRVHDHHPARLYVLTATKTGVKPVRVTIPTPPHWSVLRP